MTKEQFKHQNLDIIKNKENLDISKLEFIEIVELENDLMLYLTDSLNWLLKRNPMFTDLRKGQGISYWGLTLYAKEASKHINNIFTSWANLFESSPNPIELTGLFSFEHNEDKIGGYDKIKLNKTTTINSLRKLAGFGEIIEDGNHYIYHIGV